MQTKGDEHWTAAGEARKERNAWLQLWFWCAVVVCIGLAIAFMLAKNNQIEREAKEAAQATRDQRIVQVSAPRYRFMGYSCLDDCSGHLAGYRWAQRNGIDDEDDCTGNSDSFIEGCLAYVEENQ